MTDCERCEERERMKKIIDSFEKKNQKELKGIDKEQYERLTALSHQLKDCLSDMAKHYTEMSKIYEDCKKSDIYQDAEKLRNLLKSMQDIARMEGMNISILIETLAILLKQMYR